MPGIPKNRVRFSARCGGGECWSFSFTDGPLNWIVIPQVFGISVSDKSDPCRLPTLFLSPDHLQPAESEREKDENEEAKQKKRKRKRGARERARAEALFSFYD